MVPTEQVLGICPAKSNLQLEYTTFFRVEFPFPLTIPIARPCLQFPVADQAGSGGGPHIPLGTSLSATQGLSRGTPPLGTQPLLSPSAPAGFCGPPWPAVITSVDVMLTERDIMCKRDTDGVSHHCAI